MTSTIQPAKRSRRIQERTELTRAKIMDAATRIFSEQGFEGVSVRDIENAAGVHRGLLAYHFGDKDNLWKSVVDATFNLMKQELEQRREILADLVGRERLALLIRFHVRFYARHPELSRLMSQEARQDSWRIRYLVDKHIRPNSRVLQKTVSEHLGLDKQAFVHWYYIMVSASATIFSFAPECELLFGVDPHRDSVVEAHAEMLVSMLLGSNR